MLAYINLLFSDILLTIFLASGLVAVHPKNESKNIVGDRRYRVCMQHTDQQHLTMYTQIPRILLASPPTFLLTATLPGVMILPLPYPPLLFEDSIAVAAGASEKIPITWDMNPRRLDFFH